MTMKPLRRVESSPRNATIPSHSGKVDIVTRDVKGIQPRSRGFPRSGDRPALSGRVGQRQAAPLSPMHGASRCWASANAGSSPTPRTPVNGGPWNGNGPRSPALKGGPTLLRGKPRERGCSPALRGFVLFASIAVLLSSASAARACNVPVFRFALERWRPDNYQVIVYHRGPLPAEAKKTVALLEQYGPEKAKPANLSLKVVDLA